MRRRTVLTAAGMFCVAATTGCAAWSPPRQQGSLVRAYASLEELSENAELIVLGTAGEAEVITIDGLPFTITTLAITRAIRGEAEGTIQVRQTGQGTDTYEGIAPVMQPGTAYVAYLIPFERFPGHPTGEWTPLGVGVLAVDGDTVVPPPQAEEYPDIPWRTTLEEVEAVAARSPSAPPSDGRPSAAGAVSAAPRRVTS